MSRAARGVTDRPTVFFRPGVRRVRVPTDRLPGSRHILLRAATIPVLDKRVGCRRRAANERSIDARRVSLSSSRDRSLSIRPRCCALYQAPATATAVTCRGTATHTSTVLVRRCGPPCSRRRCCACPVSRPRSGTVSRLLSQVTVVSARGYRPTDRLLGSASACTACPTDRLLRKSAGQGSATR